MKSYKRLTYKQFVQVSQFVTHLCRASNEDALSNTILKPKLYWVCSAVD